MVLNPYAGQIADIKDAKEAAEEKNYSQASFIEQVASRVWDQNNLVETGLHNSEHVSIRRTNPLT